MDEGMAVLNEEQKGDVLILHIKGRLDAVSAPIAEKRIIDVINSGHVKLLFEMSGVTYLSSAGMRVLLSTTKRLKTLSGKLSVCCVTVNILDILKISGFDHVLDLFNTQEDALRHF